MNNEVVVAIHFLKPVVVENLPKGLDATITAVFRAARENWIVGHNDDQAFRAACGALLLVVDDETKERIKADLGALRALSAMISGVRVDIDAVTRQLDGGPAPLGLMGRWHAAKKEK